MIFAAMKHKLKNKNIIPDPPGDIQFFAGPTGELTEKDHEEIREYVLLSKKKHAKLISSLKIAKGQ